MSDNEKPGADGAGNPPADPIKNLQAEMSRKLGNHETMMAELKRTNDALLAQLTNLTTPKKEPKNEPKLADLIIDDPEAAVGIITERVTKTVEDKNNKERQEMVKRQKTINEVAAEYPEIAVNDHVLTKRAVEIFNSFDAEEQQSPAAYKAAVAQAASEFGVKPKSKRTSDDDSFSLGGSTTGKEAPKERGKKEKGEISEGTKAIAQLMGLDLSDQKVVERLKNKHGRKSYTNWE